MQNKDGEPEALRQDNIAVGLHLQGGISSSRSKCQVFTNLSQNVWNKLSAMKQAPCRLCWTVLESSNLMKVLW